MKVAQKFRALADRMQSQIDDKRRPMTQNPTPKRMCEFRSRQHEADNMERTQKALRVLADAHDAGTVPALLADLRTKDEVGCLVHKGLQSSGYYNVIPALDYAVKTPQARVLQELMDGSPDESNAAREEQVRKAKLSQLEADVQFAKLPGFFPTPAPLVERMVSEADIEPGMRVLEPSAGKGNIADVIKAQVPDAVVETVETQPRLVEILKLKGYSVVGDDFLEHHGEYDRIVMNPPFEKGQDIEHVRHAFSLLASGGRLVGIMSESPFFRSDKKSVGFRDWLDSNGGTSEKLQSVFTGKDAERQTGVNTRLVIMEAA